LGDLYCIRLFLPKVDFYIVGLYKGPVFEFFPNVSIAQKDNHVKLAKLPKNGQAFLRGEKVSSGCWQIEAEFTEPRAAS
jgi:hypothetical protein